MREMRINVSSARSGNNHQYYTESSLSKQMSVWKEEAGATNRSSGFLYEVLGKKSTARSVLQRAQLGEFWFHSSFGILSTKCVNTIPNKGSQARTTVYGISMQCVGISGGAESQQHIPKVMGYRNESQSLLQCRKALDRQKLGPNEVRLERRGWVRSRSWLRLRKVFQSMALL